ncbi:MAG TPA: enoyl-CoA hydratase/isomerase family protein [Solirubrobacteraceae bacterium]
MRTEINGALALVTLHRPEKRNALSIELRYALAEALDALAADDAVHCALLTGAGTAFCAGMDVTQFGGDRAHKERLVDSSARAFGAVARFPKPLVAYVNGPAIAGGFAIALLCDLRIASPAAKLGFPEIGRHIPPSYAAARAALPESLARELCLTGCLLDADEALRLGVVSALASLDEATETARAIAEAPPSATREVKRRALLHGERTWLPLLDDELEQLRAALLG